jgi:hypothetical protein
MHFSHPVDAIVLGVQPHHLAAEQLIWQRSRGRRTTFRRAISADCDESHLSYSHDAADEPTPKRSFITSVKVIIPMTFGRARW